MLSNFYFEFRKTKLKTILTTLIAILHVGNTRFILYIYIYIYMTINVLHNFVVISIGVPLNPNRWPLHNLLAK